MYKTYAFSVKNPGIYSYCKSLWIKASAKCKCKLIKIKMW